jgi:hypothetical protein
MEWTAQVKAARAAFRESKPESYTLANLRSESLRLPPQARTPTGAGTETEEQFTLDVPYATRDARAIAANIRGFLEQLTGKEKALAIDESTFLQAMKQLQEMPDYKDTVAMLSTVEGALRMGSTTITPVDQEAEYPLFLMYLLANTEGDPVPILDTIEDMMARPGPQEPVARAE